MYVSRQSVKVAPNILETRLILLQNPELGEVLSHHTPPCPSSSNTFMLACDLECVVDMYLYMGCMSLCTTEPYTVLTYKSMGYCMLSSRQL